MIVSIFVGQTVFFKQFYVHQKVESVQSALNTVSQNDWKDAGDARTAFRNEQQTGLEDEVKKMNLLITDMLELAKYESGTYKMEMAPFRIDAVLERVCAKLAPDITGKRLHLNTQFVPVEVEANPLRTELVVVNFMTNAIRYTPEGENIFVTAVEERETVKVCIENKGAHIPDEQYGTASTALNAPVIVRPAALGSIFDLQANFGAARGTLWSYQY